MIHVSVICALGEEARVFLNSVQRVMGIVWHDGVCERSRYFYRHTVIQNGRGESVILQVSWLPRYRPQEMFHHLHRVLEHEQPTMVLMPGICSGLQPAISPGDLVIPTHLYPYQTPHPDQPLFVPPLLLQPLSTLHGWQTTLAHLPRSPALNESARKAAPSLHFASMASVQAQRKHGIMQVSEELSTRVQSVDMEGASVVAVLQNMPTIPYIIVKGVSQIHGDPAAGFPLYAAQIASLYAIHLLERLVTEEFLAPALKRQGSPVPVQNQVI